MGILGQLLLSSFLNVTMTEEVTLADSSRIGNRSPEHGRVEGGKDGLRTKSASTGQRQLPTRWWYRDTSFYSMIARRIELAFGIVRIEQSIYPIEMRILCDYARYLRIYSADGMVFLVESYQRLGDEHVCMLPYFESRNAFGSIRYCRTKDTDIPKDMFYLLANAALFDVIPVTPSSTAHTNMLSDPVGLHVQFWIRYGSLENSAFIRRENADVDIRKNDSIFSVLNAMKWCKTG